MSKRPRSPTVTAEWLRDLATLVEQRKCSVIRCDLQTGGVVLGVIHPVDEDEAKPADMEPDVDALDVMAEAIRRPTIAEALADLKTPEFDTPAPRWRRGSRCDGAID